MNRIVELWTFLFCTICDYKDCTLCPFLKRGFRWSPVEIDLLLYIWSYHLPSWLQGMSSFTPTYILWIYEWVWQTTSDWLMWLQLWNWVGCCFFTSFLFSSLTESSVSKDSSNSSCVLSANGLTFPAITQLSKEHSLSFKSVLVYNWVYCSVLFTASPHQNFLKPLGENLLLHEPVSSEMEHDSPGVSSPKGDWSISVRWTVI